MCNREKPVIAVSYCVVQLRKRLLCLSPRKQWKMLGFVQFNVDSTQIWLFLFEKGHIFQNNAGLPSSIIQLCCRHSFRKLWKIEDSLNTAGFFPLSARKDRHIVGFERDLFMWFQFFFFLNPLLSVSSATSRDAHFLKQLIFLTALCRHNV